MNQNEIIEEEIMQNPQQTFGSVENMSNSLKDLLNTKDVIEVKSQDPNANNRSR
jgi:hypothetical protein